MADPTNETQVRLRDDSLAVIQRRLAETRIVDGTGVPRNDPDRFEPLELPHRSSPFLTLAEWPQGRGDGVPRWVIKVLMVLEEDLAAFKDWSRILEWERKRFTDELHGDLDHLRKVHKLPLPLARGMWQQPPVRILQLGPIRRLELLEGASGTSGPSLVLTYLQRPYIPWPTLRDVGYAEPQLRQKWEKHCSLSGYSDELVHDPAMYSHFCEEALAGPDGRLLLTSAWRYRLWPKPKQRNRFWQTVIRMIEKVPAVLRALMLFLLVVAPGLAAAAAEPPAVWFLNARGTGRDFVYLSVGGSAGRPPAAPEQVLLGWSWQETGSGVEIYPSPTRFLPRPFDRPGKRAIVWRTSAAAASLPTIGIGPGHELWLVSEDDGARMWADLLDAVEAAFRQTLLETTAGSRDGVATIGRLGTCPLRSMPMPGEADGWRRLEMPGSARQSRTGGHYHVGARRDAETTQPVVTHRYLRWVADPSSCAGISGLDLRLFPAPRQTASALGADYFLDISAVETRRLGFFDLDPHGFSPGVASAADELTPVEVTLDLPIGSDDLCARPEARALCQQDAFRRRQLYTVAPEQRQTEVGQALIAACQAALPAGTTTADCTGREPWGEERGIFLAEYRGDLLLHETPRLTSRFAGSAPAWTLVADETQGEASLRLLLPGPQPATLALRVPSPANGVEPSGDVDMPLPSRASLISRLADVWPWLAGAGTLILALVLAAYFGRRRREGRQIQVTHPSLPAADPDDRSLALAAPQAEEKPSRQGASEPATDSQVEELHHRLTALEASLSRFTESPAKSVSEPDEDRLTGKLDELEERIDRIEHKSQSSINQLEDLIVRMTGRLQELEKSARSSPSRTSPVVVADLAQGLADRSDASMQGLRRSLEVADPLAKWIEVLLATFGAMSGGEAETVADNLPREAGKEWRRSSAWLRSFLQRDVPTFRQLLAPEGDGDSQIDAESPTWATFMRESQLRNTASLDSWRAYFCPTDRTGRLDEVAQALQHLVEAYPIEHLDDNAAGRFYDRLTENLAAKGAEPRFHDLLHRLAAGLGYEYRPVRLYIASRDKADFSFLTEHCGTIDLTLRIGLMVSAPEDLVVRVPTVFLFDAQSGDRIRGRALVADPAASPVRARPSRQILNLREERKIGKQL